MLERNYLTLSVIVSISFLASDAVFAQNELLPPPEVAPEETLVIEDQAESEDGTVYYEYGTYRDPGQKIDWVPDWIVPDFFKEEDKIPGVKRWSRDDYEIRSSLPIGSRQKLWKGKVWPPRPRPTGPKPHLVHRFHATHYWPTPFIEQDRMLVDSVIEQHISNGWREASTLYDYHFDPETNELTHAGQMQIQWLLEMTPANRRTFFVQTSAEVGANELRVTQVQQIASRLSGNGQIPAVELRNSTFHGRPAAEVDYINKAYLDSQPIPRVPNTVGGGTTYGGSN
ncbi:MAG TPA: hypothetical protein VMM56_12765 [Planctomycetaceae bacterium]|nr:hypothetical protein [Planctomycetaceae bacterium]